MTIKGKNPTALTQPPPSLEADQAGTKQTPKRDYGILSFGACLGKTQLYPRGSAWDRAATHCWPAAGLVAGVGTANRGGGGHHDKVHFRSLILARPI